MEEPKYTEDQIQGYFTKLAEFGVDYPKEYEGMFNLISRMTAKSLEFKLKILRKCKRKYANNKQIALGKLQDEVSNFSKPIPPIEFHY